MIATITAALMTLYAAATAQAESIVRRIHDATISLVSLDRQMLGNAARTVVPEFMYREYKALYLELREGDGGGAHTGTTDILSVALAENSRPTQRTGRPLSQWREAQRTGRPLSQWAAGGLRPVRHFRFITRGNQGSEVIDTAY